MKQLRIAVTLLAGLTLSLTVYAQDYSVIPFPTLGGTQTRAFAINEGGQVTGTSNLSTSSHAFLWSRTAGIQDLEPTGSFGQGFALNAGGQVVGEALLCACQPVGFLWSPATGMEKLAFPTQPSRIAFGINAYSEVVGSYSDGSQKGFFWTRGQGMRDLGDLGCVGCLPNGINDRHQIIGSIQQSDGTTHAFIWTMAGGIKDLGTLGGPNSDARAINSKGQVVGMSDVAGGVQHAYLWTRTRGMQDLGTLPGESYSYAAAIDEAGRVVGSSWHPGRNNGRPFSWTQAGGMVELGPFTQHHISSADGVNMAGQIILSAYICSGYTSYLMTPIMHTTLTSSLNPSASGQPVNFTVNVGSAVHAPPPDGEMVKLMNGASVLGTAPLHAGSATFTLTLKVTRTLRAVYDGDSNYAPSKSVSLIQVVD